MLEIGIAETREHVSALNDRLIAGVDELGGTVVTPRDPERRGALVCVALDRRARHSSLRWAKTGSSPRSATATSGSRRTPTTRSRTSTPSSRRSSGTALHDLVALTRLSVTTQLSNRTVAFRTCIQRT